MWDSAKAARFGVMCLVAMAGMAAACGGTESPGAETPPAATQTTAPAPADRFVLSEQVSEYQQEILEDGTVTFEEYERAFFDYLRCMTDRGMVISRAPELAPGGWLYEVQITVGSTDEEIASFYAAFNECVNEYTSHVQPRWSELNEPSQAVRQQAREYLYECMREAGVVLPDPIPDRYQPGSDPDVPRETYGLCAGNAADEFGIPGFGG